MIYQPATPIPMHSQVSKAGPSASANQEALPGQREVLYAAARP
ncbi:hypothetical protein AB0L63_23200 [Nocardia sp. NPDC051990]